MKSRRGSIYILVLIVAVILTTLGLGGIAAERLRHQSAQVTSDMADAKIIANAGVEHALATIAAAIKTDELHGAGQTSRELLRSHVETQAFGRGAFTWDLTGNPGSEMSSDPGDPVRVKSFGTVGQARFGVAVTLQTAGPPVAGLSRSLHVRGVATIGLDTVVASDREIGTDNTFRNLGGVVHPDVIASGSIEGGTYLGTATPFAAELGTPNNVSGVFDYYTQVGTLIDASQLPASGTAGARRIQHVVLAPTSNPFGVETNPEGIYVIDCGHEPIEICNARIFGTILLKDPGTGSKIFGSMLIEPAVTNYPSLLIKGSISIGLSTAQLSESDSGTNFNPTTIPFAGVEDNDQDDTYPSVIRGIVYVEKDLHFDREYNRIEGMVLVNEDLTTANAAVIDLTYQEQLTRTPPPGFFEPDGRLVLWPISWTQVVE